MLLCGARLRFTEIPAYDAKMRLADVADQQLFRIIVKYGVTPFCRVRADSLSLCKLADEDWRTIQEMFDKEHKWMTTQMQKHIREVNQMFYEERRRVQDRYKEYDGTYLGHYVQYFFLVLLCPWSRYFRLGYLPDARQSLPLDANNLMFPTWLVGFILGTITPLIIGIPAENQWV